MYNDLLLERLAAAPAANTDDRVQALIDEIEALDKFFQQAIGRRQE